MWFKNQRKRFAPMVRTSLIALSAVAVLLPAGSSAGAAAKACHDKAVVAVNGMACPFCAYGLRKELLTLPGVKDVQVDLNKSQATIAVDQGCEVKDADLEQAVKKAGFTPGSVQCEAAKKVGQTPAFFKSAEFNVTGMQCENCAANITAALEKQKGVHSATVDLAAKRAEVTYDPQEVTPAALALVIEYAGKFQAALASTRSATTK
jgi:copper ion binding protein